MKKAAAMARSTSTPRIRAARGLSATALTSRPSRVPFTSHVSARKRSTATAMMVSCSRDTVPPKSWNWLAGPSGMVPNGKRVMLGPQISSATASMMVAAASELIRPAMLESVRARRGRKATRSSTSPSSPANRTASGSATRMLRPCPTSATATKVATMKTAAWARLRMSRTPKTSV